MKRFFLCGVFLCLFGLLFGCQQLHQSQQRLREWMRDDGRIKVLCTTVFVAEIVRAVGGEDVDVYQLICGQNDPHSYQLVKGDNDKFLRADIVFCSGLGLEHGASLRRRLRRSDACYLGDEINAANDLAISTGPTKDPHMWLDVGLWKNGSQIVSERLSAIRPELSEKFAERASETKRRLGLLDEKIFSLLQSIPLERRYLVTTHDAFHYFCRAYLATPEERRLGTWTHRCIAPEGLAPDSQISTQDVTSTVSYLLEHKIPVIFSEYGMNQDAIQTIVDVCQKKGFSVSITSDPLYSDTVAEGCNTYESIMWYNAKVIDTFLRGSL
jgi:manganese/zinc/iron transport system substrate-binding protein